MTRYSREVALPLRAHIDVTSLVDVAFTLLVIFIIVAPGLEGGLEVNLPDANAAPLDASDPIFVSITAAGEVFVAETLIPLEAWRTRWTYSSTTAGKPC